MQKNLVEWDSKLFEKNVFEIRNEDYFDQNEFKEIDERCIFDQTFMSYIKVNSTELEKIHFLEDLGFNYMESQYEVKKIITEPYKTSPFSKHCLLKSLGCSDKEMIKKIEYIITTSFDTDRYYLDPKFDKKYSGLRYKNWFLNSLYDQNYLTNYYIAKRKGDLIGFLMVKNEFDKIYLALGGVSNEFKGFGFYASLLTDYLNQAFSQGHKTIYSSISSHNLEILNIYIYLGFGVVDEKIVMRKIYE